MFDEVADTNDLSPELARFIDPKLADLRQPAQMAWGEPLADPKMCFEILRNKRFEGRIVSSILADCPIPEADEFAQSDDARVVEVFMGPNRDSVITTLGLAWHHVTVLDWITWGLLGEKLPGVPLLAARKAITAASPEALKESGAPKEVNETLALSDIRKSGSVLLARWAAGTLSPSTLHRLTFFVELNVAKPAKREIALVNEVVNSVLEKEEA